MEKEKKANNLEDASTIYEVSYLFLPSLAETQVPAKVASIHDAIEKAGGEVISQENPSLIDLAYPMVKVIQTVRHKCTNGYFGWIKFAMNKDGIGEMKKSLDGNDDILRFLIVKTVRENTLVGGRAFLKKEEGVKDEKSHTDISPTEPASQEEIDKSIDDLVIS